MWSFVSFNRYSRPLPISSRSSLISVYTYLSNSWPFLNIHLTNHLHTKLTCNGTYAKHGHRMTTFTYHGMRPRCFYTRGTLYSLRFGLQTPFQRLLELNFRLVHVPFSGYKVSPQSVNKSITSGDIALQGIGYHKLVKYNRTAIQSRTYAFISI